MVPQDPHTSEPRSDDPSDFTLGLSGAAGLGSAEATPLNVDPAISAKPVDLADIFNTPSNPQATTGSSAGQARPAQQEKESDEQTAEYNQYMADLMKRYEVRSEPEQVVDSTPAATPDVDEPEPEPPAERVVREPTAPPESSRDLAAMREVANLSAFRDIKKHSTEQLTRKAGVKLVLALTAMVAVLMLTKQSLPDQSVLFVVAVVPMIAATLWSVQYLFTTGKLIVQAKKTAPGQTDVRQTGP